MPSRELSQGDEQHVQLVYDWPGARKSVPRNWREDIIYPLPVWRKDTKDILGGIDMYISDAYHLW